MCTYCMIGDWTFKHDPPWKPDPWPPQIPQPVVPMPAYDWSLEKLKEYYDLLKKVKELEDQLGCPCEPNKADYLKLIGDRIAELEKKL